MIRGRVIPPLASVFCSQLAVIKTKPGRSVKMSNNRGEGGAVMKVGSCPNSVPHTSHIHPRRRAPPLPPLLLAYFPEKVCILLLLTRSQLLLRPPAAPRSPCGSLLCALGRLNCSPAKRRANTQRVFHVRAKRSSGRQLPSPGTAKMLLLPLVDGWSRNPTSYFRCCVSVIKFGNGLHLREMI